MEVARILVCDHEDLLRRIRVYRFGGVEHAGAVRIAERAEVGRDRRPVAHLDTQLPHAAAQLGWAGRGLGRVPGRLTDALGGRLLASPKREVRNTHLVNVNRPGAVRRILDDT